MELINQTNDLLKFSVKMNVSLANAIRRSVAEVLVLAVEECDFYKNDSALYDEIIAHRIGFIPLKNQKLSEGEHIELKLRAKGK
jgi:DNA-directed RNA polymerase subunit D